jgi:carboxyl-terminal processing protease
MKISQFFKYLIVAFVAALVSISFSSFADKGSLSKVEEINQYKLMQKIIAITKKNYVEEIDEQELFYSAYDGMLSSLDPYSAFLDAEDYKEMSVQTKGEFGGVGIEITMDKGVLKVVSPIDDTPAYKAGLKSGDYIVSINKESIRGVGLSDSVKKIRGKIGTEVVLTILRKEEEKPFDVSLKRSTIKIVSVKDKIIDDSIGYFRITSFSQETTKSLTKAIKRTKSKLGDSLKGIVLDVRNNPGGLLYQSIKVSDLFLDEGVIVSTKGRKKFSEKFSNATKGDIIDGKPIVVLINEGSASASEIVAGALKDNKRAVTVGKKSFGKGSVQTIVELDDKIAMKLTTAKYYTPSGESIHEKGIIPDFEVDLRSKKEEKKDVKVSGEKKVDKIEKKEDLQLAKAIEIIKAK